MAEVYPTEIYCLKCQTKTPAKDVTKSGTSFTTKLHKKVMARPLYTGTCTVCGKKVSRFAKKSPEDSAPKAGPSSEN